MTHPIIPFMAKIASAQADTHADLFAAEINAFGGFRSNIAPHPVRIQLHGVIASGKCDWEAMRNWVTTAEFHPHFLAANTAML